MAAYVGRLFTRVSNAFEFNQATLSGAIDIIVIADERGRRHCSPFHVRFGKLQLLKARGVPVSVELNGKATKLRLYLGPAGEAYFYHPKTSSKTDGHSEKDPSRDIFAPASIESVAQAKEIYGSFSVGSDEREAVATTPEISPDVQSGKSDSEQIREKPGMLLSAASSDDASELPVLFHSASAPIPDEFASPLEGSAVDLRSTDMFQQSLPIVEPMTSSSQTQPAIVYSSEKACGYVSDSEVEVSRLDRDGEAEVVDEPRSPPVSATEWRIYNLSRTRSLRPEKKEPFIPPPPPHSSPRVCAVPFAAAVTDSAGAKSADERATASAGDHDLAGDKVRSKPGNDSPKAVDISATNEFCAPLGSDSFSISNSGHEERRTEPCLTFSEVDETDAIFAEDAKLDVRSIDGFDDDDVRVRSNLSVAQDDTSDASRLPHADASIAHELSSALSEALTQMSRQKVREGFASYEACGNDISMPEKGRVPHGYCEENDNHIAMSLCGEYLRPSMSEDQIAALFDAHRVSYSEFAANPNLLYDPNMLFCVDDRLVEFRVAAPFVMASLAFGTPLDLEELAEKMSLPPTSSSRAEKSVELSKRNSVISSEGGGTGEQSPESSRAPRSFWFPWSRPSIIVGEPLLSDEDRHALKSSDAHRNENEGPESELTVPTFDSVKAKSDTEEAVRGQQESTTASEALQNSKESGADTNDTLDGQFQILGASDTPGEIQVTEVHKEPSMSASPVHDVIGNAIDEAVTSLDPFFDTDDQSLSLTPSAEQLEALDLQPGPNTIRFVVESSAAEISCRIFLWDNDTKIVISDVDGTITRSDVLGHVLPAVGRDWSHVGVAGLYTEIAKRGYKFMYLTARPIGQASQTRSFLHNVVQGGSRLPNGPVLMSPNRLVESFTREVIRRKPQEFKIDALRKVRNLFPPDYNPFHAGFGNRETDVISYRAVGLIPQRIFVVNPQAELAVMNVRYESTSSYSSLRELVDNVFPDIHGMKGQELIRNLTESSAFNDWVYWKPAMPELNFDELLKKAGS